MEEDVHAAASSPAGGDGAEDAEFWSARCCSITGCRLCVFDRSSLCIRPRAASVYDSAGQYVRSSWEAPCCRRHQSCERAVRYGVIARQILPCSCAKWRGRRWLRQQSACWLWWLRHPEVRILPSPPIFPSNLQKNVDAKIP